MAAGSALSADWATRRQHAGFLEYVVCRVYAQSRPFFFTDLIMFPEGTPLNYHSFAYPKVFAVALISKVFGLSTSSLIFQHNLSLLISFPLAGTGAFYLVRYFAANTAGALLGGFIFAFNPSHVEHVMHHAHVSSIEFIPFFVLAYLLTIDRKSIPLLISAIALFALNALSCWYYLFYVAYFILFQTVYVVIRDRALPRGWQLLAPIACFSGAIVVLSPLQVPMMMAAWQGASVYVGGVEHVRCRSFRLCRISEVLSARTLGRWNL